MHLRWRRTNPAGARVRFLLLAVFLPVLLLGGCGVASDRARAGGLLAEAETLLDEGRYAEAVARARRARDLEPSLVGGYELAAIALESQGLVEEAARELSLALQALRTDEPLDRMALLLADRLLRLGRADRAEEVLSERLEHRGPDPQLVYSLAELALRSGRPEAALATLERARSGVDLGAVGTVLTALALASGGRLEEAEASLGPLHDKNPRAAARAFDPFLMVPGASELLEKMRSVHPRDALLGIALAKRRFLEGRLEEALELTDTALAIDAELSEGHYVRARVFLEREQLRESLAELERALALAPDAARSRLLAETASLHLALGEPEAAAADLRQVLTLDPLDLVALENLALLSRKHPDVVRREELTAHIERAQRRAPRRLAATLKAWLEGGASDR
ncbi:MAG: tetratricopeptide repeat protein [Planctomycetota bacterium]